MIYRELGSTGVIVSSIGLGGAHIGRLPEKRAIRLIRTAIDRGITFLDNSWDYNGGRSETFMGKALKDGYRDRCFLMTKIDGRTKAEAARQIDQSLKRLKTGHVDLMQFHEVIRFEDPDRIFAKGGAQEAMLAAQKAGKVRYIGFTGHKDPKVHLRMLDIAAGHGLHFDAVQMPLNVMDAHFRSFEQEVLPRLVRENIGVLSMKSMGSQHILKSKLVTATECLRYALSLPTSVVITGIDSLPILEQALESTVNFESFDGAQKEELLARTKGAALMGKFELFKTTSQYDSTAQNPEWLGKVA